MSSPSELPVSEDIASCSDLRSWEAKGRLELGDRSSRVSEYLNASSLSSLRPEPYLRNPFVWLFESGVLIKASHMTRPMYDRFTRPNARNLWEEADEPMISDALMEAQDNCGGCVFLDVGASMGYYSLLARRVAPALQVHALDPHPKFAKQLRENAIINHAQRSICIHDVAASDKLGTAWLPYQVWSGLTEIHNRTRPASAGLPPSTRVVRTTTLDRFAYTKLAGRTIWLVKMDIEGLGGRSMRGAQSLIGHVKYWFVGIHNRDEWETAKQLLPPSTHDILRRSRRGNPNGVYAARLRGSPIPVPAEARCRGVGEGCRSMNL